MDWFLLNPWVVLLAIVLAAVVWAGWLHSVSRLYRLRHPRPERLVAVCEDGWELAVYRRPAERRRFEEPVLLCHGLASNHYNFDFDPPYSVAHVLSEAGFDCYTVEWRGTGGSRRPPRGRRWDYSADDHIRQDGPALLKLALARSGAKAAFWVGHSLGGLIGYGVAQGELGGRLKGLAAIGAPVFFRYSRLLQSAVRVGALSAWPFGLRHRWVSVGIAPFLGYFSLPLSSLVVNPRHVAPTILRQLSANMLTSISRGVMRQFQDWVQHDAFRSSDRKTDYRAGLAGLSLPVLVAGGSQDQLAPPANLEAQFERLGTADKTLMIFGHPQGDAEEYGHGDLIFGTGAPREVFPKLLDWLRARATEIPTPEVLP